MHYSKKSKTSFCKKSISVLLIIFLAFSSFATLAAVNDNITETGAISYWFISGSFNNWSSSPTDENTINSSTGSVTMSFSVGTEITFKPVAHEGNTNVWNGYGSEITYVSGDKHTLVWDDKSSPFKFNITKPYVTFEITSDGSKNYLTVTESDGSIPSGGSGKEYNGTVGDSIKNNSNLYTVKSSFYDYYVDSEVSKGWLTGLDGSYRSYQYREPYTKFNRAIAQYATENPDWLYPLYFGDFNTESGYRPNDYKGAGSSNLVRYKARPNNSTATVGGSTGYNYAVAGLVDSKLTDNALTSNGVVLPYFDKDFLTSNGYGSIINVEFPFRKTTKSGVEYYEFDSSNATDNIYFTGLKTNNPVLEYGSGSNYAVYDALSGFSDPIEPNGTGVFPFDKHADHDHNAYDFGFGVRMDIPFTLGANGKTNGQDTLFSFMGDDDLWVYLDGRLVLDMGGDHKNSTGSINFASMLSTVDHIDTTYKSSYSGDFSSWFDNNDVTKTHTLTVFYMERGMIESNLKINFNFQPTSNQLLVDKEVNADNVNDGVADEAKNIDEFGYEVKLNDVVQTGKNYTFNDSSTSSSEKRVTSSEGKFVLSDEDSAVFKGQFSVGKTLNITETDPIVTNNFIYFDTASCTWFENNGATLVVSFDDGNTYTSANKITSDSKDYYYINAPQEVSSMKIARKTSVDIYNAYSVSIASGKNLYTTNSSFNGGTWSTYSGTTPGGSSSADNVYLYDTVWSLEDTLLDKQISTGNGKISSFKYINANENEQISTSLSLHYENIIKTNDLSITKIIKDSTGAAVSDNSTKFYLTMLVDLAGGNNYKSYPLTYTENGQQKVMGSDGTFTISQASNILVNDLPIGSSYKITESQKSGYKVPSSSFGIVEEDDNSVVINNITVTDSYTISLFKTVDGNTPNENIFSFNLYSVSKGSNGFSNKKLVQESVLNNNKDVVFDPIKVTKENDYYYIIQEVDLGDGRYLYDLNEYYVKVSVSFDANTQKYTKVIKYYNNSNDALNDKNSMSSLTIDNKRLGSITIIKTDKEDNLLENAVFGIYNNKSDAELANTNYAKDIYGNTLAPLTTTENGIVFKNLLPGTYYIIELSAPTNFAVYCGVIEVQIPTSYKSGDIVNGIPATSSGELYDVTITVKDNNIIMPVTSGNGIRLYIVFGIVLLIIAGAIFIYYKNRNNLRGKKI